MAIFEELERASRQLKAIAEQLAQRDQEIARLKLELLELKKKGGETGEKAKLEGVYPVEQEGDRQGNHEGGPAHRKAQR